MKEYNNSSVVAMPSVKPKPPDSSRNFRGVLEEFRHPIFMGPEVSGGFVTISGRSGNVWRALSDRSSISRANCAAQFADIASSLAKMAAGAPLLYSYLNNVEVMTLRAGRENQFVLHGAALSSVAAEAEQRLLANAPIWLEQVLRLAQSGMGR